MNMTHYRNDTDRGNPKYSKINLPQLYSTVISYTTNRSWTALGSRIFSLPKRPDLLWDPFTRRIFSEGKVARIS